MILMYVVMYERKYHLEIFSNLPDKPMEGQLPYQQISALLVLADFTAWTESRDVHQL
jgi:hypothetical protein